VVNPTHAKSTVSKITVAKKDDGIWGLQRVEVTMERKPDPPKAVAMPASKISKKGVKAKKVPEQDAANAVAEVVQKKAAVQKTSTKPMKSATVKTKGGVDAEAVLDKTATKKVDAVRHDVRKAKKAKSEYEGHKNEDKRWTKEEDRKLCAAVIAATGQRPRRSQAVHPRRRTRPTAMFGSLGRFGMI
jgi:hypothetical protein